MGLMVTEDSNGSNKNYLNITGGKITQKAKEGTPNAISRVNKMGNTVWELHFDALQGQIVNIHLESSNYAEKLWVVTVRDGIDLYYLHLPYSGGVTMGLLNKLPNIDFSKELTIKVFRIFDEAKGKDKDYLVVYQGGMGKEHKVPTAFPKENPNGLPKMEQIKVKGAMVWDDTKQMEWLENLIMKTIVPKLNGAPAPEYGSKSELTATKTDDSENDNLPF
jgi:hypothetical protein